MQSKIINLSILVMLIFSLALASCAPATPAPVEQAPATSAPAEEQPAAATEVPAVEMSTAEELSGTITVLTNRTDLVDTTFVDYAKKFNEVYPNIQVEFEAMTDYAGEIQIRMNTKDYGDVLLIPDSLPIDQLPDFFESLGTIEELDPKYNFVTEKSINDQVYGLPVTGNAQGIVYNKAVFEAAGITSMPTSPDEFLADMKLIKDNTDAVPVYTNYAAGWPLTQWENHRGTVSGDSDYSSKMAHMDAPFAKGTAHYTIYKLMYDLVNQNLTEADPTTTDWEASKQLMADGKIGCMFLGSWAIVQMQEKAADPSTIGYMPFPFNIDGQQYASAGGDYKIAVNKNSKNLDAAKAWLFWFLDDSNFAYDQGGIPPVKGAELPPQLSDFQSANVIFVSQNPAPAGEEGLLDKIDTQAEIGLWTDAWKQRIIDAGRGSTDETFDDIMNEFNQKWAAARVDLGVN